MKKILKFTLFVFIVGILYYVWYVHFNYRFETIESNKVYKSAAIPPEKLPAFIAKYHIKTILDFRDGKNYNELNPVNQQEIDAEANVVAKIPGVKHINIPSPQVPTKETLAKFFDALDNKNSYPVLIHCYHGTGRAEIYSALYRIEYQNIPNEKARKMTRLIVEAPFYKSSFASTKDKGHFLITYKPRKYGKESTFAKL